MTPDAQSDCTKMVINSHLLFGGGSGDAVAAEVLSMPRCSYCGYCGYCSRDAATAYKSCVNDSRAT